MLSFAPELWLELESSRDDHGLKSNPWHGREGGACRDARDRVE